MVFYAVIFNISYLIKIKYIVDCLSSQNLGYQENLDIFWLGEGSNYSRGRNLQGKTDEDEEQYSYVYSIYQWL